MCGGHCIDLIKHLFTENAFDPIPELHIRLPVLRGKFSCVLYAERPGGLSGAHCADGFGSLVSKCLYFLQKGLKAFIGKVNITKNFDDLFSEASSALIEYIKENGVWLDGTITAIGRTTGTKTGIYMKVRVDVPYPVNKIDITLFV